MNQQHELAEAPASDPHKEEQVRQRTGRYLSGAIDLQNSIHFNREDHIFANERHGEIRYIFDANVVRFFLNPFRPEEYGKVAPFDRNEHETLQALAAVTAEYLMSRELPGQWGAAPLISEGHAHEVAARGRALGDRTRAAFENDREEQLEQFVAKLIAGAKNVRRLRTAIDEVAQPLAGLGDLLKDETFEVSEFARMINENLVRPMHLDPLAMPAVLKVPEQDMDEIMFWLKLHRNEADPTDPHRLKSIRRDAETLSQVVRLNEATAEYRNRHRTLREIRYVLVTADKNIFNGAIDWLNREAKGRLDFFPVRRLGQFIPYLNMVDTPNPIKPEQVFKDIRATVAAFLSTVGGTSNAPPPRPLPAWDRKLTGDTNSPFHEQMSHFAARMFEHATKDDNYRMTIDELNNLWFQLCRETVFVNARLLGRRINAFTSLSTFLTEARDIRAAVLDIIERTVASVDRAHVKFSIQHHLAAMIRDFEAREGAPAPRRGMAVPITRFRDLIEAPLSEFLTGLVNNPNSIEMSELLKRIEKCEAHRAFYFSAAVAFWASRWENAQFFIERALETFPQGSDSTQKHEKPDLEYFSAVVNRYVAADLNVKGAERINALCNLIEPARNLLSHAQNARVPFLICRAEMEQCLVHIHIAYCRHIVDDEVDEAAAQQDFRRAKEHIIRSFEALVDLRGNLDPDVERLLMIEAMVAVSACLFYGLFYVEELPDDEFDDLRPFTANVEVLFENTGDMLPKIYRLVPDLLKIVFTESPTEKRDIFKKVIGKMNTFTGESEHTTRMDNQGIVVFQRKLRDFVKRSEFSVRPSFHLD
ncbi:hypothetical protein [Anderseniella sp. Alg231-50]|uniref:hypothetical protein n=1 Tax=Anderseniella sp. Alg231-50 TaxID=1922226 RepID=UPI000D556582